MELKAILKSVVTGKEKIVTFPFYEDEQLYDEINDGIVNYEHIVVKEWNIALGGLEFVTSWSKLNELAIFLQHFYPEEQKEYVYSFLSHYGSIDRFISEYPKDKWILLSNTNNDSEIGYILANLFLGNLFDGVSSFLKFEKLGSSLMESSDRCLTCLDGVFIKEDFKNRLVSAQK